MPRDYKDYRSTARGRDRGRDGGRRKAPPRKTPGWVWGLAGLCVGLAVAVWVHLSGDRPAPPGARAPAPAHTPVAESGKKTPEPAPAAQKPAPVAPAPKPRFEFYTLLPEMEVPVQEPGARGTDAAPPRTTGETYILQVASFRSYEEADRLKANLSLMGLDASIQSVAADGKGTVHRVRVGPYSDIAKVNEAKRRLKDYSLEPIVVKGRT